ncbi:hypothetical protein ACOME3_008388 [Neoechinorhynchus agilis]
MGKKQKIGKQRRDKFYSLAKEVGYRSRAAFKLIQLNRTYRFLENSKVCVDLCAAPGGWLQVAQKHMPVSSLIVGVDLYPIKPIACDVKTIRADITTAKCKVELDQVIGGSHQADIVLHDGAPNMGTNWLIDAYNQNSLVLRSAELAAHFLRRGGWFVSKVFRSKDYLSLQWVLKQLFGRVQMTKPQASRAESAEIFVVCSDYLAPDRIDPKLFNPINVFGELNREEHADGKPVKIEDVVRKEKKGNKEGYPEGKSILYKKVSALQFVRARGEEECLRMLIDATEMIMDDPKLAELTNSDINHMMSDLRRMTKRDLKNMFKWRRSLRSMFVVDEDVKEGTNVRESGKQEECVDSDEEINRILAKDAANRIKETRKKKKALAKQKVRMTRGHENMALFDDVHTQDIDFRRDLIGKCGWLEQKELKALMGEGDLFVGDVQDMVMGDVHEDREGDKKLSPEQLAIGHALVQSKKRREEVIDEAYHRFMGFGDDEFELPDWFVEDERKHCRKRLPDTVVDPRLVKEYRDRSCGLNVRSAKKVLEAKARKLKRDRRRLKAITSRVDEIPDDLEPSERKRRIAEIYKANKRMNNKKRGVQYVIAKKSGSLRVGGSKTGGKIKLVDRRMKKDKKNVRMVAKGKTGRSIKQTKKRHVRR